ncbi:MAG: putative lysin domain protein [Chloroflexi bacterium]|nr:putative lysin domain protein [Chloroflexota bacterium]
MEAYPTLKTRIGLPSLSLPPILLGLAAVAIAAVALFFLPALLGVGNAPEASSAATASPSPSGIASTATPFEPTQVPGPTPQIYLVQSGDTMSRIASKFGIPLQVLIDANAVTIPNPDVLDIGQEVIIPSIAPTSVPDAGGTPSPAPS